MGCRKRIVLVFAVATALMMVCLIIVSGGAGAGRGTREDISSPAAVESALAGGRDPKIESVVSELAAVSGSRKAEDVQSFAASRGIDMKDGKARLVVEMSSAAAAAEFRKAIEAGAPDDSAGSTLKSAVEGGVVETSHGNLVQMLVPPERIGGLAALPSVSFIRLPVKPVTFSVTSEGVADASADVWHSGGIDGEGVKVAVTDLGFSGYENQVAAGELPSDVIVNSFSGDISGGGVTHGTGCAEIAYDMAPGAQFYLLNFSTEVELANMIDYIISEGIDVVSASWAVPINYRGNGEGAVNDMVNTAYGAGVFWANAAGNSAQNHWGGFFQDLDSDNWHEFATGDEGNGFTAQTGELLAIYLTWDNWPATDQDYDLYLYKDGLQTPVAVSGNLQTGTQYPYEEIYYVVPPGMAGSYHLSIANAAADGSADFQLFCHFGVLEHQVADRSIAGQPADSPNVTTVGAVQVNTNDLMYYSSRGPTLDGRIKPDVAAPTHVSTMLSGPLGFGGTSGATPHVAGAAALLKEAKPAHTPDQIKSELEGWAIDLGAAGKDNDFGSGKLDLSACAKPPLGLNLQDSFWGSYQEFVLRKLSVTWSICNSSSDTAYNMQIIESYNTQNVYLLSGAPYAVGDIAGEECATATLKYSVPMGVASFLSTTRGTAADSCEIVYSYPG